jgi:acyl carrier protein
VDVRGEVRRFIENELRRDVAAVGDDASLLEAGILDSVGVLSLVAFIEQRYGFGVSDEEMMPENFDTIEAIASFVSRRRTAVDA